MLEKVKEEEHEPVEEESGTHFFDMLDALRMRDADIERCVSGESITVIGTAMGQSGTPVVTGTAPPVTASAPASLEPQPQESKSMFALSFLRSNEDQVKQQEKEKREKEKEKREKEKAEEEEEKKKKAEQEAKKYTQQFAFTVSCFDGKSITLAAQSEEERQKWLITLMAVIAASRIEEDSDSSSSGSDQDEFGKFQMGERGPTITFAVGKNGATGVQGPKDVKAQEVSDRHSEQARNTIPIWAQVIYLRMLVLLVLVSWMLVWFTRGSLPSADRTGPPLMLPQWVAGLSDTQKNIFFASSELVRERSEKHEYNVEMWSQSYATLTPTKVDTDSCLIRLINTCEDPDQDCGKANIHANFMPAWDPDCCGKGSDVIYRRMLGYLELAVDPEGRKNLVVGMPWAPTGISSVIPENIWNPVVCEMYLVVPTDAEVHLRLHKATIVARNVSLRSLTVQGVFNGSLPEQIELFTQNLSISHDLHIAGSSGRVVLHDLNVGSQSNVSVSMIDSSIDVTSLAAPSLEVESVNKAVCLVGPMRTLNTSTLVLGNETRTVYSSTWQCPNATDYPCSRPFMKLQSTGAGAVSFHALSMDANGVRSEIPQPASTYKVAPEYETQPDVNGNRVEKFQGTHYPEASTYCGAAFSEPDSFFTSHFVSVDHSPVQNDESELAIISISGPGMNFGNLQVVWALQKIWFAFPALWPLWTLSFSIVFPTNPVKYEGTIAFCPAHGPRSNKDLSNPLMSFTKDLYREVEATKDEGGVETAPATVHAGYWILRNLGGILDALHPMTQSDGMIPPCDYCARRKTQSTAVGTLNPKYNPALKAMCEATEFPDRAHSIECSGNCSAHVSANRFTMVPKGTAECFENW